MRKKGVKTHTFNGQRYEVYIGPLMGIIEFPKKNTRSMDINTHGVSERTILITTIHEAGHASNLRLSEKVIDRMSNDIGSFLWRLGYRRKHGEKT